MNTVSALNQLTPVNRPAGFIPFSRPCLGIEEETAVLEVIRSGWLTTAEQALRFETEFKEAIGTEYALAVNSGTAALHLALEALSIGPEDFVLTTPYTFTASAEIIRYLGANPLFVDIEEESYNIDPHEVHKKLQECASHVGGKRIAALIPVHIGGDPCRMDILSEMATHFHVPIVEDAAHAFPVRFKDRMVGAWGKAAMFSFYANKTITTGEGGMLLTSDATIAERAKIMRLHGIDRDVWKRYTSEESSWRYDVVDAGYKYNMPDMAAAIGRAQLRKAERFRARRKDIAASYTKAFGNLEFLEVPPCTGDEHAWHLYLLRVSLPSLNITRDEFMHQLSERGIGTSVHFIPLHLLTYYKRKYGFHPHDYPRSLEKYERSISLPIYPDLSEEDVRRVIDAVIDIGVSAYTPRRSPGFSRGIVGNC